MVRGGYGSGSGVPLRDRVRGSTPPQPAAPAVDQHPARHCWISAPVDGTKSRPGLLIEWRRVDNGRWEGRVAYVAELRPGRWALVEEWVPAELLSSE
ncbi:hypothetical protein [Nocardioides sp. InS609-2]|uniref:hypothetical protein n=1 Tax=Nocardioides sp. InS609-2 TaxID=2760705 RepID=UPI0017A7415D|nr:hypothetical protein [Nocardioides sp. InS609-2]MBA3781674.1 hypothetical protein [Nocardioides sp.]